MVEFKTFDSASETRYHTKEWVFNSSLVDPLCGVKKKNLISFERLLAKKKSITV